MDGIEPLALWLWRLAAGCLRGILPRVPPPIPPRPARKQPDQSHRFSRRRHRPRPTQIPAHRPLLRDLFQQNPQPRPSDASVRTCLRIIWQESFSERSGEWMAIERSARHFYSQFIRPDASEKRVPGLQGDPKRQPVHPVAPQLNGFVLRNMGHVGFCNGCEPDDRWRPRLTGDGENLTDRQAVRYVRRRISRRNQEFTEKEC